MYKRKVIRLGLVILLLGIMTLGYGGRCGKDDSDSSSGSSGWSRDAEMAKIAQVYYSWASALKNHNYTGALSYCYPGGNGEGMTNVAKDSWDSGSELYYNYDSVRVWNPGYLSEDDIETTVRGNVEMYQEPSGPNFYMGFCSSARKVNGVWLIDGHNMNYDPNWWE